ncbi:MAG: hypothetical protein FWG90_03560 [Oscillospiraceae bacterium]|nr:hypothetical protein [Oscillospiraceae bacterium]
MLFATPLGEIIKEGQLESIIKTIDTFVCKDKDVELFLKQKAFDFERRDKGRTYLVFDDNETLLGYFTLTLNALPFSETVSKSKAKNIDGFSKDVRAVGIILIGQFGKDLLTASEINGDELFNLCLDTVYSAKNIIGGRFVMLECLEIDKVVSFYRKNGFEPLQYDKNDKYLQMVRRL